MHTQLKKIVAVAGLVALALTGADAQVVAQWNFNSPALPGGLRNYGPDAYLPATIAPGFSTDGLTRGSGVVTNQYSGMAKAWGGYHFAESSPAAAATGGDYYAFSLSRDTAAPLSVKGIKTTLYRSNTGPTNALWQYRLAGAANWQDMGGTVNLAGSGSVSVLCDLDTSGIAGLQNIASSVTFRLVAWGGGGSSGTYPYGTLYFDGQRTRPTFTVYGTVNAVIPEPATGLLLCAGAALLAATHRTRRRKS